MHKKNELVPADPGALQSIFLSGKMRELQMKIIFSGIPEERHVDN